MNRVKLQRAVEARLREPETLKAQAAMAAAMGSDRGSPHPEAVRAAQDILRIAGSYGALGPEGMRLLPEPVVDQVHRLAHERARAAIRRRLVRIPGCVVPLVAVPLRDLLPPDRTPVDSELAEVAGRLGLRTKQAYPKHRDGPMVLCGWRIDGPIEPPADDDEWAAWWRRHAKPGPQLQLFRRMSLALFGCWPDWSADAWRAMLAPKS